MSLPDDEIREPEDNMGQAEDRAHLPEEQAGASPDLEAEDVHDSSSDFDLSEAEFGADDATTGEEMEVAVEGADESIDFAAPAETESGVALDFDLAGEPGEPDEAAGDDALAGPAGLAEESEPFDVEKAEDEAGEDEEEADDEDQKKPAKRAQRILAAIGQSDPYTVLMGIALLALLFGILFFYLELSAYNFDIGAERAKQLVGSLGFGWLLGPM